MARNDRGKTTYNKIIGALKTLDQNSPEPETPFRPEEVIEEIGENMTVATVTRYLRQACDEGVICSANIVTGHRGRPPVGYFIPTGSAPGMSDVLLG